MAYRQGSVKKNNEVSQHRCNDNNGNPTGNTNKKVRQTNSECGHGVPTSTSLRGLWDRSYNCKLSFSPTHVDRSEEVNYTQNIQRQQTNPNPSWGKHSNFSWANDQGHRYQIQGNPQ